jgi:hypothetical protein
LVFYRPAADSHRVAIQGNNGKCTRAVLGCSFIATRL